MPAIVYYSINSLRKWIKPCSQYVTQIGINKDICQWLLISTPGNPIFLKAAERSIENININNTKASYSDFRFINNEILISNDTPLLDFNDNVLALADPRVLQQVAEEFYKDSALKNILPFTQITCDSGSSVSCQMNGNVNHGCEGMRNTKKL